MLSVYCKDLEQDLVVEEHVTARMAAEAMSSMPSNNNATSYKAVVGNYKRRIYSQGGGNSPRLYIRHNKQEMTVSVNY